MVLSQTPEHEVRARSRISGTSVQSPNIVTRRFVGESILQRFISRVADIWLPSAVLGLQMSDYGGSSGAWELLL